MKKAHTILAEYFSMDSQDVYEGRHHYGLTRTPVYVIGNDYYTVAKVKPGDEFGQGWQSVGEHGGRTIWESKG